MSIPNEEVQRRVALLKKLKETLLQQREKFHSYMQVLEAEKTSIESDQIDRLQEQVKIEERLVVEIHNFQKVIDPLEAVFQQAYPYEPDREVESLKTTLATLKDQVQVKNQENRTLLSRRMTEVRTEILRIRPNLRGKNPYGSPSRVSTLVDTTA